MLYRFLFYWLQNGYCGIEGKTKVNVRLNPEEQNLDEVQVVAFGTQKKESVVSAITTIRPMDLKSSSSDLTSSLPVKLLVSLVGRQEVRREP